MVKRHGSPAAAAKKKEHTFSENEVFREKWVVCVCVCGGVRGWGLGGSPFMETSNINSQRERERESESCVRDMNQFLKVWSFPLEDTTKYRAEKWPVGHIQGTQQNLLAIKTALNPCKESAKMSQWNQAKLSGGGAAWSTHAWISVLIIFPAIFICLNSQLYEGCDQQNRLLFFFSSFSEPLKSSLLSNNESEKCSAFKWKPRLIMYD